MKRQGVFGSKKGKYADFRLVVGFWILRDSVLRGLGIGLVVELLEVGSLFGF